MTRFCRREMMNICNQRLSPPDKKSKMRNTNINPEKNPIVYSLNCEYRLYTSYASWCVV